MLHAARVRRGTMLSACWKRVLTYAKTSLEDTAGSKIEASCSLEACPSDTLKEVQMKSRELRARLRDIAWPELRCFEAHGRVYDLPLSSGSRRHVALPARSIPTLRFMAGFFDGDGCVSCTPDLSGCCLVISQSFDKAEVLMLFYGTFGGSITRAGSGMGLCKPSLRWAACGQSARNAAELLAPHSITKQQQLFLAAQWPDARSCREECKAELRALKECDSAVAGPCSWEYFAGFFDAEGYIQQRNAGASLDLQIGQKHPRVLKCLREFVTRSLGMNATLRKLTPDLYALEIGGLLKSKQILQHLLHSGLLSKARQAELAVGLTPGNAAHVWSQLAQLTGNQMFGKKLDATGLERAKKISSAQAQVARLRKAGHVAKAVAKLGEVEVLKREHELLNACRENQQLLEYMHRLHNLHENSWDGRLPRLCDVTATGVSK